MSRSLQQPVNAPRAPARDLAGTIVQRSATQSAGDPYEFVMSSDAVDRLGDIVEIDGLDLTAFQQNPIAFWNHNRDQPIGTWDNVRKKAGKLVGKLQLAAAGTSQLVDELRSFIEQRILKTVSIGFRVIEAADIKGSWGVRFTKSELLECSLVSIPANKDATRIRALMPDAPAFLFSDDRSAPGSNSRTAPTSPTPRRQLATPDGRRPMKTLAEQITDLQSRSATIDDAQNAIHSAAANENDRELSDDELTQLEALNAEKSGVVRRLAIFQDQEAQARTRAMASQSLAPTAPTVAARVARIERPGAILGKLAAVSALAYLKRCPPEAIIAQRYADDDRVAACWNYVERAAAAIADTTTPGWAAEMVSQQTAAFLDFDPNVSVFAALRARGSVVSLSLVGTGKITIPMRINRGNLAGAWVGEGGVIPVLQGTIGSAIVERTKLAGITTFTRELLEASNDQIETILSNALRDDTADVLDKALLDAGPRVAGIRPKGLQNGANTAASAGADKAAHDLQVALAPILAAGGGKDIVLIMNPQQFAGLALRETALGTPQYPETANGKFKIYPVIPSNNVPAGVVFVMDAAFFVNAAGAPEFLISEETVLTMANADGTAPTQAVDFTGVLATAGQVGVDAGIHVAGGPAGTGTAGVQAMSMYQQYAVAQRLIMPVNWVMTRANMVSTITSVAWGN